MTTRPPSMSPLSGPVRGEILKLGAPASGEVVITVDPGQSGATFAAGTQTLLPRAEIPFHRHLDREEMLVIHKGQGRAILGEQTMVVVPGMTLHVPRGTWFTLRNTGTGALQFVWASSPGLEAFFRELSRLGASPSAQAFQELAQRHGIELRPAAEAPRSEGRPRRGRRGGRRNRGGQGTLPSAASRPAPESSAPRPAPAAAPAVPSAPTAPGVGRRRRRRRGGTPAVAAAPPAAQRPSRPDTGGQRPLRGRHRRRVKEVYMGGRWIQVEGEGPVIAPGRGGPGRRSRKPNDDEPPSRPLSVPL